MKQALKALGTAFCIGGFPWCWIFVYLLTRGEDGERLDLRQIGTGNVGASNAVEFLGLWWYLPLITLDASKSFAAIWLAREYWHCSSTIVMVVAFTAVLGHCFPVWLSFKRGKGLSATIGVLLSLQLFPELTAGLIVFSVMAILSRRPSVGALLGTLTMCTWAIGLHRPESLLLVCVTVLIWIRFSESLVNLLHGREAPYDLGRLQTPDLANVWQWVLPLRPAACLLGFMITLASWAIAYRQVHLLALYSSLECFWFLGLTMVANNWFDRHHDAHQKIPANDFALRNQIGYLVYLTVICVLEVIFIHLLWKVSFALGALALFRAVCGFFYSWTRKVMGLSAFTTAMVSALCCVTPAAAIGKVNPGMWKFLVATACAIFAWECLKDVQDFAGDLADGYKWTIAVVKGPNVARLVARYAMVFASLVFLSMPLTILPAPAAWGGVVGLSSISIAAFIVFNARKAKKLMGSGMALFLVLLNSSYWLLMSMQPVQDLGLPPLVAFIAFAGLIGYMAVRPDVVSGFIRRCQDNGSERLEKIRQSRLLWPVMYALYFCTICICRLVCGGNMLCTAQTGLIATLVLLILVIARPAQIRVPGRSHGYTAIDLHSIGIAIGFFFTVCDILGLPIAVVAFIVPLVTIIEFKLEPFCHVLRNYSCWWGIVVGVAIVKGIMFALANIMPAYFAIVAIYFIWRRYRQIPVFIPNSPLGNRMKQLGFVPENVLA